MIAVILFTSRAAPSLGMFWWILLLLPLAVTGWLLFSPIVLEIDTRIPGARIRWVSIGGGRVWYEEGWWWSVRTPFFRKTMRFSARKKKEEKEKGMHPEAVIKKKKKARPRHVLEKSIAVLKTFRVRKWKLALDTGDYVRNAQLYPLNFMPGAYGNLDINFRDENYFVLKISNRPWRILFAFIRKR